MRERRIMLGLTQQGDGRVDRGGLSTGARSEKGINRVTGGRLYHIAQALGVEVGHFFEGLGGKNAGKATPQQWLLLKLARCFIAIPISQAPGCPLLTDARTGPKRAPARRHACSPCRRRGGIARRAGFEVCHPKLVLSPLPGPAGFVVLSTVVGEPWSPSGDRGT